MTSTTLTKHQKFVGMFWMIGSAMTIGGLTGIVGLPGAILGFGISFLAGSIIEAIEAIDPSPED